MMEKMSRDNEYVRLSKGSLLLNPVDTLLHCCIEVERRLSLRARSSLSIARIGVLVREELECPEANIGDVQDVLAVHSLRAVESGTDAAALPLRNSACFIHIQG